VIFVELYIMHLILFVYL